MAAWQNDAYSTEKVHLAEKKRSTRRHGDAMVVETEMEWARKSKERHWFASENLEGSNAQQPPAILESLFSRALSRTHRP